MTAAARICGGMDGRPLREAYMSANIPAGNTLSRCSAGNANTLPAGINSRQVAHTSDPTSSPCMTAFWPDRYATGPEHRFSWDF